MGFNQRRAAASIAETIRTLAEPRQVTAVPRYPAGALAGLAPAVGHPDLLALGTGGLDSQTGGWETTRANYHRNLGTGGLL